MRQRSSGDGCDKIADPIWQYSPLIHTGWGFCVLDEIRTILRGWEVVMVWRGGENLVVLKMEQFFCWPGGTHHFYAVVLNDRRGH